MNLSFTWQQAAYALPAVVSALIVLLIAFYVWRSRREAVAAFSLLVFLLAVAVWNSGYAMELLTPLLPGKLFWVGVQYIGIVSAPVLWLVFALVYVGLGRYITPSTLVILFLVPLFVLGMNWTNHLHQLFYTSNTIRTSGVPIPVLENTYGPVFWVNIAFVYLMLVAASLLLIRQVLTSSELYRRQALVLLIASFVPWIANIISVISAASPASFLSGLDVTPLGFTVAGGIVAWGLFDLRVLEIAPAAYDSVFTNMSNAVFVLDDSGRVLDANPAAERVTGLDVSSMIGTAIESILDDGEGRIRQAQAPPYRQTEIVLDGKDDRYTYTVRGAPLTSRAGRSLGTILTLHDITSRKQAEHALRESEVRYRSLFEATFEAIIIHHEGYILAVNEAFVELVGFPREQIIGSYVTRYTTAQGAEIIQQRLEQKDLEPYETEGKHADGRMFPIEIHVKEIVFQGKQARVAAIRDLTEHYRMLDAEREQRILADALRDTADALNSTLDIDDVLDRILEIVGEVVPHSSATFMLIEDGEAHVVRARGYEQKIGNKEVLELSLPVAEIPNLQEMVDTGQPVVIPDVNQVEGWRRTPVSNWIESYAGAPIRLDGETIGFLNLDSDEAGFFTPEHADRLQAFADQAAAAIKNARLYGESQRRNRQLMLLNEITRIAAATVDLDTLLSTLADSAANIIGGDGCYITLWDEERQQVIPGAAYGEMRDVYLSVVPPPSDEQTFTRTVLEAGQPLAAEDVLNSPYISRRIAEQFPARAMLAIPLQADDRDIGALMIAFNEPHHFAEEDINWAVQAGELIALAIAKAQTYTELEARNEELDAFGHTVAHDLKSPLGGVIGFLSILLETPAGDMHPEDREVLALAKNSALKLNQIIDGLLLLARVNRSEQPIDAVPIGQVARSAVDRFRLEIEQRGVQVEIDPDLPPALGFGPWVEEVFANLISNAIKYIGRDNDDPCILISGERINGTVRYTVTDNGLGIEPENQQQLFEMFQRFHIREARGLGLGLSIVKRVVTRLNGDVGVESDPGEGSTFWFTLPAVDEPVHAEASD